VEQGLSAMKVCTDACVFGAWVISKLASKQLKHVLDIGSGTGLLSLMVAQETNAEIDAVEIDKSAYRQTKININQSQWALRLHPYLSDIKQWKSKKQYDLVICNPPFFSNDLQSPIKSRSVAMHESELTLKLLFSIAFAMMDDAGYFALLMDYRRHDQAILQSGESGFYTNYSAVLKHDEESANFRSMFIFSKSEYPMEEEVCISIKDRRGDRYTNELINLLKPFYLYL